MNTSPPVFCISSQDISSKRERSFNLKAYSPTTNDHKNLLKETAMKKHALAITCFAMAAYSGSLLAGEFSISGEVLEKGTRKPLQGVVVTVTAHSALSATSDERGHFHLTLPSAGSYTLSADNAGMTDTLAIELTEGEKPPAPTFYLHAPEMLDEMVVTAERSRDRLSKNSISGKALRQIAGSTNDPLAAVQSLPGVATVDGTSAPAVRGSGPGDNLYYVDGLRVYSLFHLGFLSIFNADLIEGFELYSAAFSPHYGDITGAVLDVTLRAPRTDRLGSKLNINMMGADFLVEGPVSGNQSFYFAGRRSYADLFVKQIEQNGATVQVPSYSDYQGKYLWQVNDANRVTLHLQGAADIYRVNLSSTADAAKQQPDLAGDSSFSDENSMQAVTLNTLVSGTSSNTLSFEHFRDNAISKLGTAGTANVVADNLMLREKFVADLAEGSEVSLGGDFLNTSNTVDLNYKNATCTQFNPDCSFSAAPRLSLNDSFNNNALGVSAQVRQRALSDVTLIGGVRYSYEDYARKAYTEPRIGMEWAWTPSTLFTAGWGKHNQHPALPEWVSVFGNPNLDHIRAEHTVMGIQHKVDTDWSWKAETYYKKLDNLVVNDPLLNYINAASGKAYGLELLVKKEPTEKLSGWFVLNLAKSERRNDVTGESFRCTYDQPVNATLIGNYKLSGEWSFGMKWAYHSGSPYTPIIGTNGTYTDGSAIPVYAAVNSGTLPDYHRLDLRMDRNYVFNRWKLNTYFELNNVYQRQNIVGYTYNASYTSREPINAFVLPFSFGVQAEF